jgi:hypothetical protein
MRIRVYGCICLLYVILLNICRVHQIIFIVQCELSKLQINPVKIFHFSVKTTKTGRFVENRRGFTSTEKFYTGGRKPIFSGVYRNRQC